VINKNADLVVHHLVLAIHYMLKDGRAWIAVLVFVVLFYGFLIKYAVHGLFARHWKTEVGKLTDELAAAEKEEKEEEEEEKARAHECACTYTYIHTHTHTHTQTHTRTHTHTHTHTLTHTHIHTLTCAHILIHIQKGCFRSSPQRKVRVGVPSPNTSAATPKPSAKKRGRTSERKKRLVGGEGDTVTPRTRSGIRKRTAGELDD
jgi:uncharacterized membrane protein YciS (DUF1049 family)